MAIKFKQYRKRDQAAVIKLILKLYEKDAGGEEMTKAKAKQSLKALSSNSALGSIQVIKKEKVVIGYCLLVNYWSNEYGGNILFVDELYLKKKYRNSGIGSQFLQVLKDKVRRKKAVALSLEVMPDNKKAYRLYKKLGFRKDKRRHLMFP